METGGGSVDLNQTAHTAGVAITVNFSKRFGLALRGLRSASGVMVAERTAISAPVRSDPMETLTKAILYHVVSKSEGTRTLICSKPATDPDTPPAYSTSAELGEVGWA